MVDESDTNNNNNTNNNKNNSSNKMANGRAKRRRSLFSVLFNSTSKSSSQEGPREQQQNEISNPKNEKQMVLIKPQEAKCIEATIIGLNNGKKSDDDDDHHHHNNDDLFKRIKDYKKGKMREDDADSYVIDLEDRLEVEKLRSTMNSVSKLSRSSSSINLNLRRLSESPQPVGRFSREPSPLVGGQWRTNRNYVPIVETIKEKQNLKAPERPKTRQTSPMLEKFFSSYQIQFDSTSSNEDDSSCDSLNCPGRPPFSLNSRYVSPRATRPLSDLSNPAERLNHWQRLAARTTSSWNQSSSLDSDSELELLASDSPALVCYCSDDTSCSSVELIWSRPQLISSRQQQQQQQQQPSKTNLLALPTKTNQQHRISATNTMESQLSGAAKRSITNSTSDLDKSGQCRVQRAAIFELAKPSRARDRRIGVRGERRHRRRRDGPHQREVTPLTPDQVEDKATRGNGRNSADWVANPLFSTQVSGDDDVELNSMATSEESNSNIAPTAKEANEFKRNSDAILEELTKRLEEEDEKEEELDSFSLNGSSFCDRDKKHRWSLRVRSPIGLVRRDNAYLSHLINLDKRIKSNVSSFKNQLSERISDTGKRASVLADQLITSIKDTTKEQLLFTNGRDRYDTLPNSFASSNRSSLTDYHHELSVGDHQLTSFNSADPKKAQLFSLIYKHQQQANGQAVITSQPRASVPGRVRPIAPPRPPAPLATAYRLKQSALSGPDEPAATKLSGADKLQPTRPNKNIYNTIDTGQMAGSRSNDLLMSRKKRLKPRKARRQINVAAADSGDEGDDNSAHGLSSRSLNTDKSWKFTMSSNKTNVTY